MLVPVSPSGTGKTLSRLTSSWLDASQLRLPSSARLKSGPSTPVAFVAATTSAALFAHALDVDVDPDDRHVDRALDLELHRLLQVVGDLGDADPVLDDDVDVDDQSIVLLDHVDALVHVLTPEQLGEAVAEAAAGHPADAIAAGGGVSCDRGHRRRKYLDSAPLPGLDQGGGRFTGGWGGHQRAHGTIHVRAEALFERWPAPGFHSSRKVTHGQTVRDLRQDAAVRTSRQPRQEPGQPEVSAQPPDGPRDGGRQALPRTRLHPLPEDLHGLEAPVRDRDVVGSNPGLGPVMNTIPRPHRLAEVWH